MFASEVVSCAQTYVVRGCECKMYNEQPKVVGAQTSANKEYLKSKAASNSFCIFLERDPCLRRATDSCKRSRASQTDGYNCELILSLTNLDSNALRTSFHGSIFQAQLFYLLVCYIHLHDTF